VLVGEFELGRYSVAFFLLTFSSLIILCVFVQTAYGNVQDHGSGSGFDDPEVLEAMEIFAGMSPEEMEETIKELMLAVDDDPEMQAKFQEILEILIPQMQQEEQDSGVGSNLREMVEDDEVAAATQDAVRSLGNLHWESLWEQQEDILEAVIASGKITPDAAVVFKTEELMWEQQLRHIWEEMQKKAALEQEL
jgi:hypothetical protein